MDGNSTGQDLTVRLPATGDDARIGSVLGDKYRLTRRLGVGGMGAVYEAVHTFVGRRFAVKFLHAELAADPGILLRFEREAKAAGALISDHVVAINDFGVAEDGDPYIVMELLEGEDLRGLLRREPRLDVVRAVSLVIQSARGLAAAHAQGVVHRDLKPENLFLCRKADGSELLKVVDFGIAKLRLATSTAPRTQAGTMIGTLLYMPPEQIRGDADLDVRADVYALGVILYEALAGRVPFLGEEAHTIIYRVLHERPPALGELRPELPLELVAVVERAMAFDRERRFVTVDELANALTPFAGSQVAPIDAAPPEPAAPPMPIPRGAGGTTLGQSLWVSSSTPDRKRSWWPLGALGLVVVVGVVGRAWLSGGTPQSVAASSAAVGSIVASAASAGPDTDPDARSASTVPAKGTVPVASAGTAKSAGPPSSASPRRLAPAARSGPASIPSPHRAGPAAAPPPSRTSVVTAPPASATSTATSAPSVIRQRRGRRTVEFDGANLYE